MSDNLPNDFQGSIAPTSWVSSGEPESSIVSGISAAVLACQQAAASATAAAASAAATLAAIEAGNFPGGGGTDPTPPATTATQGKVKLAGDLGGTADSPTVPGAVKLTGNQVISGILTFSSDPVFNDNAIPQAKVAGLSTSLGLKADSLNPVFTGSVNVPSDSIPQAAILDLITTLAAKLDKSVYDAFFASTQFAAYDVFCPNDVDVVRPVLAPTARVRWHKLNRPTFGGVYAQVRDSWVQWSG